LHGDHSSEGFDVTSRFPDEAKASPTEIPETTGVAEDPADDHAHGHGFINQGSRFMLLDNLSRAVEPLLVLTCARLYAGGEWGFFKYYESLLLLMARVSALGMQRGVVWIHAHRPDDAAFTRAFSRALNLVLLIATGLALIAGAQWTGWLPSWSSFARGAPGSGALNVACLLAALPLQAGSLLFVQTLINKRRLLSILLVRNLAMPAFTLAPAIVLSFTPLREHGVAVPYLVGSLVSFVMGAVMYARAYGVRLRDWSTSPKVPRDLLRYSLPLGSTDVFMTFAYRVDVILLGRFAGLQAVEVYSVVMMIANTLRSIRQSFDGILLSVFSRARSSVPTPGQVRHFNYAAWMVMTLQLPFVPAVLLFGGDFLGLVGPTYVAGAAALGVAVFFNAWMTLGAFSEPFVAGMGRTRVVPIAQAVFFAGSVVLNFLLIPRLGIAGAALASGLAYLLGSAVNFGAIWRFNGGSFLLPEFWKPFVAGMLMLAPAAAAAMWPELPMLARAGVLALCLVPYAWYARRNWRRYNLAR
jgi:O-antigen/teichoic acid export membrane protein